MTKHTAGPATIALIGGIAASLAGNLQAINLGDSAPGVGAYVSALFWPVALFVAIEVMLRTPWLSNRRDNLTKWVGLAGVAGVALYVSYGHLLHVLGAYGYDSVSAHVGPLAIDGLMAMATLSMNRVGQSRRAVPVLDTPEAAPAPEPIVATVPGEDNLMSLAAFLPQPSEVPALEAAPVPVDSVMAPRPLGPEPVKVAVPSPDAAKVQALVDGHVADGMPLGQAYAAAALTLGVSARTVRRKLGKA